MIRSRATGYDEREISGVLAVLYGDLAHGRGHVYVDNLVHTCCALVKIVTQPFGDLVLDGSLGFVHLERHFAPGKEIRIKIAEHEVSVGHRRKGSPAAVASGAWDCSGTLRADPQLSALVDPSDTAPSRADGIYVYGRNIDAVPPNPGYGGVFVIAIMNQADVETGAAHIGTEEFLKPYELSQIFPGYGAAARA